MRLGAEGSKSVLILGESIREKLVEKMMGRLRSNRTAWQTPSQKKSERTKSQKKGEGGE